MLARVSASAPSSAGASRPDKLPLTWGLSSLCLGFQQSMRENKEKQALSDLMIKPVQRIPRYELLVKVGMELVGQGGKRGSMGLGGAFCSQTPDRNESPVISPAPKAAKQIPVSTQDLLKHTPEDHPDHPLLLDAQRNIKQVAERINKGVRSAEEAERHARVLQEIEAHIEGMEDVCAHPARLRPTAVCLLCPCLSVVTETVAIHI